jgi:hypothetical protein
VKQVPIFAGVPHVVDGGVCRTWVDHEGDPVCDAMRLNDRLAAPAVESESSGDDRLQRVALRAAGWADIGARLDVRFVCSTMPLTGLRRDSRARVATEPSASRAMRIRGAVSASSAASSALSPYSLATT